MRRLPLLLAIVAGAALWAAPSQAQVTDFFKQYTADGAAPGEGNIAVQNGYVMCPPHADYCSGSSELHHHVVYDTPSGGGTVYETNVINTMNCAEVVVCARTAGTDGANPEGFIQAVSNNAGALPTNILADVDGNGVIDSADLVALDGDDGNDSDGDGTDQQTSCMYGIVANRIRLDITDTDGDAIGADAPTYFEVSCR